MNRPSSKAQRFDLIQFFLVVFALLACLGAVLRMLGGSFKERIDDVTLQYLAVAGALLLLREVKSLSFGNYKLEFDRKLDELQAKVENAQAAAVGGSGAAPPEATIHAADDHSRTARPAAAKVARGAASDDPWKGAFGNQSVSGTRRLSAEVTPMGIPGVFRVRLEVASTNATRDPLRGSVQFFLHPTFRNDRPVVTVGPNGVAELTLNAWGAFTVGALVDDGRTRLELDLATLPSAPADFKSR